MKIILNGVTSFTGFWFAKTLSEAGHEVVGLLTNGKSSYQDLKKQRLEKLTSKIELIESIHFGDQAFLDFLDKTSFDLFCHHAAFVENYKSADFDYLKALAQNTKNVQHFASLVSQKAARVVLTGSVFEADEGLGNGTREAFSPYGLSKKLTYETFRYYLNAHNIPFVKFVITNPFGVLEEPRFTNYLIKSWVEKKCPKVNTPDYVRDNIHVDHLAKAYLQACSRLSQDKQNFKLCPSGHVESQGQFAIRFTREMSKRLNLNCQVDFATQTDFSEPMIRIGSDPVIKMGFELNDSDQWDLMANFYAQKYGIDLL